MTSESVISPPAAFPTLEADAEPGLKGDLSTFDIVLATLAYAGPLAGAAGYTGVVIGYGNGIGAPVTFLVITATLLLFSVGFGAVTRYVPNPGAFYSYVTAGLGRPAGLGSAFLILGAYFALGVGFYAFAGIASKQLVEGLGGPTLPWWLYATVFWSAVAVLAYFHVAVSAKVLGVLLVLEIVAIAFFDLVVISGRGTAGLSLEPFSWGAFNSGNIGLALIFTTNMFSGFEATAIYREETRDPDVTIPRATYIVVLFIGLVYAITAWCILNGLGLSRAVRVATNNPPEAYFEVARRYGGVLFYQISSILLLTSTFASHLAIQNVTTRYVYSLASDGVLPRYFGIAHRRFHSPHRASIACSIVYFAATGGLFVGGLSVNQIYTWFAGLSSFAIICAMAGVTLAVIVYFSKLPQEVSHWSAFVAPFGALLALSTEIVLGIRNFPTLISGSRVLADEMLAALFLLFAGGAAYALWLRKCKPWIYQRIGRQSG